MAATLIGNSSAITFPILSASFQSILSRSIRRDIEQYYEKVLQSQTTHEVASRVGIEFHDAGEGEVDWRSAFQLRSAYRNESDFRIEQLRATRPQDAGPRLARIIDPDVSVSKNYERMAWKRMQAGSSRFSKGDVTDFHYKNLSGGEKAAVPESRNIAQVSIFSCFMAEFWRQSLLGEDLHRPAWDC